MTNPFSTPLPSLHSPESLGLDARPAALKRWTASLNTHDLGSSTRQLYEQLRLTNRCELPVRVRFEWLESLAEPLKLITDGLRKHYQNKPFPLSNKGQSVAQLANALHHEMMLSYRRLLAAPADNTLLGRSSDRQMRRTACYRLFVHSGEILCNHRFTYSDVPHGLWRHLHAYYARVRRQGWAGDPVPGISPEVTLERQYRALLLHSLLPSPMIPLRDWQGIQQGIDSWTSMTPLLDISERPTQRAFYCIRFELDAPLAAITERCCGACTERPAGVLFDTAPLVAELERRLQAAAPQRSITRHEERLSHETLQMLLRSWRIHDAAREQRKEVDIPLTIVFGVEDIHAVLSAETQSESAVPLDASGTGPTTRTPDFTLESVRQKPVLSAFPVESFLGQRDQEGDIWDTVYVGKEIQAPQPVWGHAPQEKKVEPLNARAVDASTAGYRLVMELPENSGIRLGELIAVHGARIEGWELFLLRWIRRIDERRVTLGLQRIGDGVRPVDLIVQSNGGSRALLRALTALDEEMNSLLLMPLLPSLVNKRFALGYAGKESGITLAENRALSPLFDTYHYHTSEALAEQAAWLREARQPDGRDEDPFHEVWRAL